MKNCRITVLKKVFFQDLADLYENPIQDACDLEVGDVFVTDGYRKPEGLCECAWRSLFPYVMTFAHGGKDVFDGWMKDPYTAMVSCNDGFRPVTYYLEAID